MGSTTKHSLEYANRKRPRPFVVGQPMHVTLRSNVAKEEYSMASPRISSWLRDYLPRLARMFRIRLHHFSNNGSHLHLVIVAREKESLSRFFRVLSGMIPRKVLGVEKNNGTGIKFWVGRPYSRVLGWGREFRNVMAYVERNVLESVRRIPYIDRNLMLPENYKEQIDMSLKRSRWGRESWAIGQGVLF